MAYQVQKITISDLVTQLNLEQTKNQDERQQKLHLSQLAICGYKYRYELDNNKKMMFSWKFLRGNAIESLIWWTMRDIKDNSYIHNPRIEISGNITGSPDFISHKTRHIIELKSSKSDKYKDIYERQLKAYMFLYSTLKNKNYTGSLWMYNTIKDSLYSIGEYETLSDNDIKIIKNSIESFTDNEYKEGIENSLCDFCINSCCKMNKNNKNKTENDK